MPYLAPRAKRAAKVPATEAQEGQPAPPPPVIQEEAEAAQLETASSGSHLSDEALGDQQGDAQMAEPLDAERWKGSFYAVLHGNKKDDHVTLRAKYEGQIGDPRVQEGTITEMNCSEGKEVLKITFSHGDVANAFTMSMTPDLQVTQNINMNGGKKLLIFSFSGVVTGLNPFAAALIFHPGNPLNHVGQLGPDLNSDPKMAAVCAYYQVASYQERESALTDPTALGPSMRVYSMWKILLELGPEHPCVKDNFMWIEINAHRLAKLCAKYMSDHPGKQLDDGDLSYPNFLYLQTMLIKSRWGWVQMCGTKLDTLIESKMLKLKDKPKAPSK